MIKQINLNLTDFVQPSFHRAINSRARDLVLYGGAAAGKSECAARKVIAKSLKYSGERTVVIRKYSPSLRLTCFTMIMKILSNYQIPAKINRGDMTITFANGSDILFIPIVNTSGEPGERIKSLTDLHTVWYEEPTELSYDEFQLTRLRLRGEELKQGYRQRILTFNPIDKNHWLFKYYFETDRGDKQKYTYLDNKYIDSEAVQELINLQHEDRMLYNVYALGEWGTLENQIYTNYTIEQFEHPLDYYDDIVCGVDFGFENPSTLVIIGVKEKTLYIIDEIYKRKLINTELIKMIQGKLDSYAIKNPEIFCDTAEPARIEEMKRAGLNVREANKNVIEGINVVKKYRQVIHPRCVEYIKEIAGYKRKEDRNGNVLEDPVKFADHTQDALRYACMGLQRQPGFLVMRGLGKVEL